MRGSGIDRTAKPSGDGCLECLASGGWWLHLRRCAACGHVGCCDSSPEQHASRHAREHGHPVTTSFEPNEDWSTNMTPGRCLQVRRCPLRFRTLPRSQFPVQLAKYHRLGKHDFTEESTLVVRSSSSEKRSRVEFSWRPAAPLCQRSTAL